VHTTEVPPSGAGLGGKASPPEPLPPPAPDDEVVEPLPALPDPPEHIPMVVGWHSKPSPQSASALQGSCHL
jgi:hypothetical protein